MTAAVKEKSELSLFVRREVDDVRARPLGISYLRPDNSRWQW